MTVSSEGRAVKAEILASTSHDLRAPLNAIIGFSEVLMDGLAGPMNEKQKDCVGEILASGKRLLALIDDALGIAPPPVDAAAPVDVAVAGRGVTRVVLVVDDDPQAVELIAAFLPAPAYKVVRAGNGVEAVTMAHRVRPDLILLDLMMPGANGFDVVGELRKNLETTDIPILILTARQITELDREVLGLKAGGSLRIIGKAGFDRAAFVSEVQRALAGPALPAAIPKA